MLRSVQSGAVFALVAALSGGCGTPSDAEVAAPAEPSSVALATSATPDALRSNALGTEDWEVVGTSVLGRPIRARTFGHGPRIVLFVGGIHGDEAEGAYTAEQLPAAFEAAGLSPAVTLTILEDANPDGRAAGTRGNANGIDVNRNFPATNFDAANPTNGGTPLSQPESRALFGVVDRIQPNLVLVSHAWVGNQFINFDGPAQELAQRFSASSGLPVEASTEFAPTPGSLGSYVGRDRGIPVLTIEVLKGSDPQAVWNKLQPALLEAIGG